MFLFGSSFLSVNVFPVHELNGGRPNVESLINDLAKIICQIIRPRDICQIIRPRDIM